MSLSFTIFQLADKTVHVPNSGYMPTSSESQSEEIQILKEWEECVSMEAAILALENHKERFGHEREHRGTFVILPTFKI